MIRIVRFLHHVMVVLSISREVLMLTIVLGIIAFMSMCAAGCTSQRDPCSPVELAAIQAAYTTEVVSACKREGSDFDSCQARTEIEERYARLREEWARCH